MSSSEQEGAALPPHRKYIKGFPGNKVTRWRDGRVKGPERRLADTQVESRLRSLSLKSNKAVPNACCVLGRQSWQEESEGLKEHSLRSSSNVLQEASCPATHEELTGCGPRPAFPGLTGIARSTGKVGLTVFPQLCLPPRCVRILPFSLSSPLPSSFPLPPPSLQNRKETINTTWRSLLRLRLDLLSRHREGCSPSCPSSLVDISQPLDEQMSQEHWIICFIFLYMHACMHAPIHPSSMVNSRAHISSWIFQGLLPPVAWLNPQPEERRGFLEAGSEHKNLGIFEKGYSRQRRVGKEENGIGKSAHISFSVQLLQSGGKNHTYFFYNLKTSFARVWRLHYLEFCQICFLEALSVYLLRENT